MHDMFCLGAKPHLKLVGSKWMCYSTEFRNNNDYDRQKHTLVGWGSTPDQSYRQWAHYYAVHTRLWGEFV